MELRERNETAGILEQMIVIVMTTPRKRRAGKLGVQITPIAGMWTSSSKVIPGWAKMPLFRGSTSWTTPALEFLRTRQPSTTI